MAQSEHAVCYGGSEKEWVLGGRHVAIRLRVLVMEADREREQQSSDLQK